MTDPRPNQNAAPASPLSEERVREYEEMLSAVTPGPWTLKRGWSALYTIADCGALRVEGERANVDQDGTARFLAASPTIVREFIDGYRALLSDRAVLTARLDEVEAVLTELVTELRDDARMSQLRARRYLEQAARGYALIEHRLPSVDDMRGVIECETNHIKSLREFDAKYFPDVSARAEANDEYDAEGHKR